jgi:hypothetical protein
MSFSLPLSRLVLVAALAAALFIAAPARADEISDLKAQNELLARQLDAVIGEITRLKDQMSANQQTLDALATQSAAQQSPAPGAVASGGANARVELSGQVNRMVLYGDDGTETRVFHADNDNSSTRFRIIGEAGLGEVTAGAQFEFEFRSNNSNSDIKIDQDTEDNASSTLTERKIEVYFDHAALGRVWLGQGPTASDGTGEADLSGTSVVTSVDAEDLAGGLDFRTSATGVSSGIEIGDSFDSMDGGGRADRIRYDTPGFYGAKFSASHADGDSWDIGVKYGAAFDQAKLKAALGYRDASATGSNFSRVNASASILFSFGGNISLSYAGDSFDDELAAREDRNLYYVKLGYRSDEITRFGTTAFSIDYYLSNDQGAAGEESTAYGLAAVQKVSKIGTDLYVGLRNYALERPGLTLDDIVVLATGARVKF